MSIEQVLGQALRLHQAGRLAEAEGIYRQVLAADPDQPDALHRLGLLENQKGHADAAEGLIRKAIAISPREADYRIDLGVVLTGLGRFEEAAAIYGEALLLKPDSAEGQFNLATALSRLNRFEEAVPIYRKALALRPDYVDCLTNLGLTLKALGRLEASLDTWRRILALRPDFAEGHNDLGLLLLDLGRPEEAADAFRRALVHRPDFADALNNLGNALVAMGHSAEAMVAYSKSQELQPGNPVVYYNAGNALKDLGLPEQSIAAYRRALALKGDYAKAANNLGLMLTLAGRHDEAEDAFRRALASDPNYAEAYNNLGKTLKDQGRLEEAMEVLRRAMALDPNYASARNNLAIILTDMGRLEEGIEAYRRAVDLDGCDAPIHSNFVFSLHYLRGNDGALVLNEARRWDSRHAEPLRRNIAPHGNPRDPDRRLRIGYISRDFCEHVVSRFLYGLFQNHDHQQFEIACYSDVTSPDRVTETLRACVDGWHNIVNMPDARVAERIRGHGIDILVDLTGHTTGSRLLVFARKAAPVQMTWLGHPGTTGLATMDYRLTDGVADPPGTTEDFYTEKLLRLPRTNWCYAPPDDLPEESPPPVSLGRPVCFGSFNKLSKASPQTLDLWAAILKGVSGSRLLLKDRAMSDRLTRQRTRQEFERRGIDPERLELAGFENDLAAHFRRYSQVDVALDTFPYHGTTTTCEALWMGVPVVTLAGVTHVARVGASLLTSVGLAELIAHGAEEYISIATSLAGNEPRLRELRGTLRQRMRTSPLMDGPGFARDVEAAYREVWRRWCTQS